MGGSFCIVKRIYPFTTDGACYNVFVVIIQVEGEGFVS